MSKCSSGILTASEHDPQRLIAQMAQAMDQQCIVHHTKPGIIRHQGIVLAHEQRHAETFLDGA